LFEESDTLQLFWNLYAMTPGIPKAQSQVLKVLVLLSSVRRSLFTGDDERKAYLSLFVDGIVSVLNTKQGLNVSDNYHQFCRLLARLKVLLLTCLQSNQIE
jgi:exportin-7